MCKGKAGIEGSGRVGEAPGSQISPNPALDQAEGERPLRGYSGGEKWAQTGSNRRPTD